MTPELLTESTKYVISADMFWGVMGFTTAIGMFLGALLYDGRVDRATRGVISVGTYASMIMWANFSRVAIIVNSSDFENVAYPHRAPANLIATMFITVAWLLGVIVGVTLFKKSKSQEVL